MKKQQKIYPYIREEEYSDRVEISIIINNPPPESIRNHYSNRNFEQKLCYPVTINGRNGSWMGYQKPYCWVVPRQGNWWQRLLGHTFDMRKIDAYVKAGRVIREYKKEHEEPSAVREVF